MSTPLNFDRFPLFGTYDVVVCGGGPSGAVAATASARLGAKTLIVEQYGFLGGALTGQGVHPMMTFHAGDRQVIRGIPDEVVQRMVNIGASPGHIADAIGYASSVTPFDAEGLKIVLEEMLARCRVELGEPDVVVHNAARGSFGNFLEIDPADVEENFRVNTMSLLYLARAVAPAMIERGDGAIMVTGNTSARRGIVISTGRKWPRREGGKP